MKLRAAPVLHSLGDAGSRGATCSAVVALATQVESQRNSPKPQPSFAKASEGSPRLHPRGNLPEMLRITLQAGPRGIRRRRIKFWKMHGAGNDFILIDDRRLRFPSDDRRWISRICAPHEGIGAEGLILLQPSQEASCFMRFFNPDGSGADMCGNGLRCAARLAYDLGIAGKKMTIKTPAGVLKAAIMEHGVLVAMPLSSDTRLNFPVQMNDQSIICSFINTGVSHVVVETDNLEAVDLQGVGPLLRRHNDFAPRGTNVDFMKITGPHSLAVRTYERGVEAETLACGTGITACAIIAALLDKVAPPVRVTCRRGDTLEVDFKRAGKQVKDVTLLGPAEHVFQGEISYP